MRRELHCVLLVALSWAACMVTEGAEELQHEELLSAVVTKAGPETALRRGAQTIGTEWPSVDMWSLHGGSGARSDTASHTLGEVVAADPAAGDEEKQNMSKPQEEYFKIPHLKYEYKSTSQGDMPLESCQQLCDSKEDQCKSFSFNYKTEECLLSQSTFAFNPGWVYYSKENGESDKEEKPVPYLAIPGLKYQSDKDREIRTGELGTCQQDCDADKECVGFGFSESTKACGLTFDGAIWLQDWSFFLKPAAKHDHQEMLELAQRRMPELRLKAQAMHADRHKRQYEERDSKEHMQKEQEKQAEAEKRVKEHDTKEQEEKRQELERADKEKVEKAQQEEIHAKETKDKDAAKCKTAIAEEQQAATQWHTCKLRYVDFEGGAEDAKKAYETARKEHELKQVNEKSAKSQAGQGDNSAEREQTAAELQDVAAKEAKTALQFDTQVKAAKEVEAECKTLEDAAQQKKQVSDAAGEECREASQKQTEARVAEQQQKLDTKTKETTQERSAKEHESTLEKNFKEQNQKSAEAYRKQQKALEEKQAAEEAAAASARDKTQENDAKAENQTKEGVSKEKAEKAEKSWQDEVTKEAAAKKVKEEATSPAGAERLAADTAQLMSAHAKELTKRADDLKQKLTLSGSNDAGRWAEEGLEKEKGAKAEKQTMDAQKAQIDEKNEKVETETRNQKMENADKVDEQKRKNDYAELVKHKQLSKADESTQKTDVTKEATHKELEEKKRHFEAQEKMTAAEHRAKTHWLQVQAAEHKTKAEWANAKESESGAKAALVHTREQQKKEVDVKTEQTQKEQNSKENTSKTQKEEAEKKRVADENQTKEQERLTKEQAEQGQKAQAKLDGDEREQKRLTAQEIAVKESDQKLLKNAQEQSGKEKANKENVEKATESQQKQAALLEKQTKENAEKETSQKESSAKEKATKERDTKEGNVKAAEAKDKADAQTEKAQKQAQEEGEKAEVTTKTTKFADAVSKEKTSKAQVKNQESGAKVTEQGVKLQRNTAENAIKVEADQKRAVNEVKEGHAKNELHRHEKYDKVHEREQDSKESRIKKAPHNMTYAVNWETDIDTGYNGAYSYKWKQLCVLGGVLSSVGDITKEKLHKKKQLWGHIGSKGIKGEFWSKLGPQTTMINAIRASHLSVTKKQVWFSKLSFPVVQGEPWDYLDHDYVKEFAANFTGQLLIHQGGVYNFFLTSTGISELWIEGEQWSAGIPPDQYDYRMVVNNGEPLHGMQERSGSVTLEPGTYHFVLKYYVRDPDPGLILQWSGPTFEKKVLAEEYVGQQEKRDLKSRFAGLEKTGFKATFCADIGMNNNVASAQANCKIPSDPYKHTPDFKTFSVLDIDYSTELAPIWEGLNSRFKQRFFAKFDARLMIEDTGIYQFWLTSVDGAVLTIGDVVVCNNDGLHPKTTVEGQIELTAGTQPIQVRYFDNHNGAEVKLEWKGPQTNFLRVKVSGVGSVPAVGIFSAEAMLPPARRRRQRMLRQRSRRLLSQGGRRLLQSTDTSTPAASPVNGETKNRRRSSWSMDSEKGVTDNEGKCSCQVDARRRRFVWGSYMIEVDGSRRRLSSETRRRGKETPAPAPALQQAAAETDIDLDLGELSTTRKLLQTPAAPATGNQSEPEGDTVAGMACTCPLPPLKAGWQADFWKTDQGGNPIYPTIAADAAADRLSTMNMALKGVQDRALKNEYDKQAIIDKVGFPSVGTPWEIGTAGEDGKKATFGANFVAAFQAYLQIRVSGTYHFYVVSNDGAELYVDDKQVVDNDGRLGKTMREQSGSIELHQQDPLARIRVYYYNRYSPAPGLFVYMKAPCPTNPSGSTSANTEPSGPPCDTKVVLDGNYVAAHETWAAPRPATLIVRRRVVARRRLEMSVDELKSCNIPVTLPTGAAQAPPEPPQSNEQNLAMIAKANQELKKWLPMEHEAAIRAQHHPNAEAQRYYVTVEVDMKQKITKVKQEKGVLVAQEKVYKKNNPQEVVRSNASTNVANSVMQVNVSATNSTNLTRPTTNCTEQVWHVDCICEHSLWRLRCCDSYTCDEDLMNSYVSIRQKINQVEDNRTFYENKARQSATAAEVRQNMKLVQAARKEIGKLNTNLTAVMAGLNNASSTKETSSPTAPQVVDSVAAPPAEASTDFVALIDIDEEDANDPKEEAMSEEQAKAAMDKARELAVKEKCSAELASEATRKDELKKKLRDDLGKQVTDTGKKDSDLLVEIMLMTNDYQTAKLTITQKSILKTKEDDIRAKKKMEADIKSQYKDLNSRWDAAKKAAMTLEDIAREKKSVEDQLAREEAASKETVTKKEPSVKAAAREEALKKLADEKSAKANAVETIASLPAGCRPQSKARFLAESKEGTTAWVDIHPDGQVKTEGGLHRFISLDGIMFATTAGAAPGNEEEEFSRVYLGEVKHDDVPKVGLTTSGYPSVFKVNDQGSELKELTPEQATQSMLGEDGSKVADWDDYQIVHVFNTPTKEKQATLLGAANDPTEDSQAQNQPEEKAPLSVEAAQSTVQAIQEEFEKIQSKYNDPNVWTMCSLEGGMCKAKDKFKMKFGAGGDFRYKVSDGSTPCSHDVFGAFPWQNKPTPPSSVKQKCYKYTPDARRRRASGVFKDILPTGIKAQFYTDMGTLTSLAQARNLAKSATVAKEYQITGGGINFPLSSEGGYWDGLDTRFEKNFYAKFTGVLKITKPGSHQYTFHLTAGDGASLKLDTQRILPVVEDSLSTVVSESDNQKQNCNSLCKTMQGGTCVEYESSEKIQECFDGKSVQVSKTIEGGSNGAMVTFFLDYYKGATGDKILKLEWTQPNGGRTVLTDQYIGQYEKFVEEGGNWEQIATDTENFSNCCTTRTEVRYGIEGNWVYKFFDAGAGKCNALTFGDPAIGKPKVCQKRMDTKHEKWYPCATESQICKGFPTEHKVRFGAGDQWTFLETMGDTACNADQFGDPAPGVVKGCWVLFVPPAEAPGGGAGGAIAEAPYNLAQGRPTKQISVATFAGATDPQMSVAFEGDSAKAVDGNTIGKYGAGSCTHTYPATQPWWMVQLDQPSNILTVNIYGRTDSVENCKHVDTASSTVDETKYKDGICQLTKIQVLVGNKPFVFGNKACGEPKDMIPKENEPAGVVDCKGEQGTYVFVQSMSEIALTLCEVEVIGLPANVTAAGGPAAGGPAAGGPAAGVLPLTGIYDVELRNGWGANGINPKASVERECDLCENNLCVFQGYIKNPSLQNSQSTAVSIVGALPDMCLPKKQHTFAVTNGDTGSAEVTVHPDGKMTVAKLITSVASETANLISLTGVTYFTNPKGTPTGEPEADNDSAFIGYDGFSWKKMGPFCFLWGKVVGKPGTQLATTPAACRPKQKHVFHVASSSEKAWISVNTEGVVRLETTGPIAPTYEEKQESKVSNSTFGPQAWVNPLARRNPAVHKNDEPLLQKMFPNKNRTIAVNGTIANVAEELPEDADSGALLTGTAKQSQILVAAAATGNQTLSVQSKELLETIEGIEMQEGMDVEEGEDLTAPGGAETGDGIWVSLAGIVWSVEEHHAFQNTTRAGALSQADLNQKITERNYIAPVDVCTKPKVESHNYREKYTNQQNRLTQVTAAIANATTNMGTAVSNQQKSDAQQQLQTIKVEKSAIETAMNVINGKEILVKSKHAACFLVSLSQSVAAQLNVPQEGHRKLDVTRLEMLRLESSV